MKWHLNLIVVLLCVHVSQAASTFEQDNWMRSVYKQSLVNMGDLSNIKDVLCKAASGNAIKIGAIGGSITMGAAATEPHNRYINQVAHWFKERYPNINIELLNAGIGSTDSKFGAFRLSGHLLAYEPDIVIVEYSINDSANTIAGETFEGLIRQLLRCKRKPAVIIMAMMNAAGANVEQEHLPVAAHYDIPMVSLKKWFKARNKAGGCDPQAILEDDVHPNDAGHRTAAQLIIGILQRAFDGVEQKSRTEKEIPSPLYSDRFEHVGFWSASDLKPTNYHGWILSNHKQSHQSPWRLHGKPLFDKTWTADRPGSEIGFQYKGTFVAITFWKENADMGRAEVFIDGHRIATLDGWGPQSWGGYACTKVLGKHICFGEHHVRIVISSVRNENSNGHRFNLLAFGFGNQSSL